MPKKRSPQQRRKGQQRSRVRRRRQADAQSYQSALQRIAADRAVPPADALAGLVTNLQDDFLGDPSEDELYDWDDDETLDDDAYWPGEKLADDLIRYQEFSAIHRILDETIEAVACLQEARPAHNLRMTLNAHPDEVGDPMRAAAVAYILALLELSELAVRSGHVRSKAAAEAAIEWLDAQLDFRAAATARGLASWFGTEAPAGCPPECGDGADRLTPAVLLLAAVVAVAPHDHLGRPDLSGFGAAPPG